MATSSILEEDVQATLQNCSHHIASILRSTISTVDELARVGTLVQRDFQAAKNYSKKQLTPTPNKKEKTSYSPANLRVSDVATAALTILLCISRVTSRRKHVKENKETTWEIPTNKWTENQAGKWHKPQSEKKVRSRCTFYRQQLHVEFFIMNDCDLQFPSVLRLNFLTLNSVQIDFGHRSLTLLGHGTAIPLSDKYTQEVISLYLAVSLPTKKSCYNEPGGRSWCIKEQ